MFRILGPDPADCGVVTAVDEDEDQSPSMAFEALRLNCSRKLSICTSMELGVLAISLRSFRFPLAGNVPDCYPPHYCNGLRRSFVSRSAALLLYFLLSTFPLQALFATCLLIALCTPPFHSQAPMMPLLPSCILFHGLFFLLNTLTVQCTNDYNLLIFHFLPALRR